MTHILCKFLTLEPCFIAKYKKFHLVYGTDRLELSGTDPIELSLGSMPCKTTKICVYYKQYLLRSAHCLFFCKASSLLQC